LAAFFAACYLPLKNLVDGKYTSREVLLVGELDPNSLLEECVPDRKPFRELGAELLLCILERELDRQDGCKGDLLLTEFGQCVREVAN
jgi:hypothetical protein